MMYLVEISPRKLRGVVSLTAVTFASLGKLSGRLFGLRYVYGDSSFFLNILQDTRKLLQIIIGKPCSTVPLPRGSSLGPFQF